MILSNQLTRYASEITGCVCQHCNRVHATGLTGDSRAHNRAVAGLLLMLRTGVHERYTRRPVTAGHIYLSTAAGWNTVTTALPLQPGVEVWAR